MIVTSKIKEVFGDELIRMISAICQTRRIQSNKEKMLTVYGLLNEAGIEYEPLGDATNRLAIQKDAYAFKIALDQAGYKDNWMEYALSDELQPYVTNTFETNGFIAVAECVKSLSEEEYFSRKAEMTKILDAIGGEYLLGDVGITQKNYKNWGVRDSGEIIILDYAYVHRATEDLFLCTHCGEMLRYNEAFTELGCYGRDGCGTVFKYENKRPQIPDSEIQRVIDTAKDKSILMSESVMELEETKTNKFITDPNTVLIRTYKDYELYLKEANKMYDYEEQDGVGSILKVINDVKNGKSVKESLKDHVGNIENKKVVIESIIQEDDFFESDEASALPEPVVIYDTEEEDQVSDEDPNVIIDRILQKVNKRNSLSDEQEDAVICDTPYEDEEGKAIDVILERMNKKRQQGVHNEILETVIEPTVEPIGLVIGDSVEEDEVQEQPIQEPKLEEKPIIETVKVGEDTQLDIVDIIVEEVPKVENVTTNKQPSKYDDFDPESHMEMSKTLKKHLMDESNKSRHIVLKNKNKSK